MDKGFRKHMATMIDIVIFEDDADFSAYIKKTIEKNFFNCSIPLITSNFEALRKFIELLEKPAIFILDIMFGNEAMGFKMADLISQRQQTALTVFITNYPDKILINSFYKIRAFNIILKASRKFENELDMTIRMAMSQIAENNILIYKDRFTTISIKRVGIIYAETIKGANKIAVYHKNGIYEIRSGLSKFLKQLPSCFIRCHNSYIINTNEVIRIHYSTKEIFLTDGHKCRYSYAYRKKVGEIFNHIE